MATTVPPRPALPAFTWRMVPPLAAALALGLGILASIRYLARPLAILILAITPCRPVNSFSIDFYVHFPRG